MLDRLKLPEHGRAILSDELLVEFSEIWQERLRGPFRGMRYFNGLKKFMKFIIYEDRLKAHRASVNEKMLRNGGKIYSESVEEIFQMFVTQYLTGFFRPENPDPETAWDMWKTYYHWYEFVRMEDVFVKFKATLPTQD